MSAGTRWRGPSRPAPAFSIAALASALLAACCGPAKCLQARSGRTALEGVVKDIEAFKERNGRYPVRLDDLRAGYADSLARAFAAECPACKPAVYGSDAFGYRLEFGYDEFGRVRCVKDNENEGWVCEGIY